MSMSTHVVGMKEPTAEYRAKWAALDACKKAGVPIPNELVRFFEYEESPDASGMIVEIKGAESEWSDPRGGREGIEVDLSKLPEGVTRLRFYNAY